MEDPRTVHHPRLDSRAPVRHARGMPSEPDFTVRHIDARVRFRAGVLGRGRLALLVAIAREGARGRALGATAVQVRMQVGNHVSQGGLGDVPDLPH